MLFARGYFCMKRILMCHNKAAKFPKLVSWSKQVTRPCGGEAVHLKNTSQVLCDNYVSLKYKEK